MISYITEININSYQTFIQSSRFVIVYVYALWCPTCASLHTLIDQISSEYNGRFSVAKLDYEANREISDHLTLRNIPAVVFYKDGEVIEKLIGVTTNEQLVETINTILSE